MTETWRWLHRWLSVTMVELSAATSSDMSKNAIKGNPPLFVGVQASMQISPKEAAALRLTFPNNIVGAPS